MDFAAIAIRQKTVTLVLTVVLLLGGLSAYQSMSRLEDPEFTIKDALVITPYPGASAAEVEEEVSDEMERAVQQLGQLDEIESRSERGRSTLTVTIKAKYDKETLPQVWDELRRKIGDAQSSLPPGAGPSIIIDDYGDVYGVFVALYGDEYSYAELKEVTDLLRKELALVQDVSKVEVLGEQSEVVYIELNRDRMSQLGIPAAAIVNELQGKNLVSNSGRARVGAEFITIEPSGLFQSVEDFETLLITGADEAQIYLRDVATVRRGYKEPASMVLRYDGKPAIALGISTVTGGNVITMGEALEQRFKELVPQIPLGIQFGIISLQSDAVTTAISGFVINLLEAVGIVIGVLLLFMGVRSGLLIGFILLLTILGSFIFLQNLGVALERISLGALIIALGMLVDNAIVVVDGMLVRMQQGQDAKKAASEVVNQSGIPLLGATIIAILAFAAIGTSDDSTGEFCRSLFTVVMVSLLLSWVTAVTVTPLLGVMFLKAPAGGDGDAYSGGFYGAYKRVLATCIRARWATVAAALAVFAMAVVGFGNVKQSFFPPSTRPQFIVDIWLPQGTHIDDTRSAAIDVERYLTGQEGVTHVTSLIGQGGLRFLLTYTPEKSNSAFVQFLVDVDDASRIDDMLLKIEADIAAANPDILPDAYKFVLGPGGNRKVEPRFKGPDIEVLRGLADRALVILQDDPDSKAVHTEWRERVKVVRPIIAEEQANLNGITRSDIATALKQGFEGMTVGVYREGDLLLPIIMRAPQAQRIDINSIQNLQIWSRAASKSIPLRQVVSGFETGFEDEIIIRKDRKRSISVFADAKIGMATELLARARPQIEAIELPAGYSLEWGGEFEDSAKAQGALAASIPTFIFMMILVTIALFNNLRQPLIIWCCVPLAIIGVSGGLLASGQPFGFMSLLGALSLIGMLIKNAIVLIDQINLELSEGKALLPAIIDSGASRLRPVGMAASTTALGMLPLFFDAFFVAMAITIVAGLVVATVLTMIIVPVLYALFYKAPSELPA